ncbi:low-density lipoprotein receptor-related protein 3-like [Mercenaria mercenaria]|uniref:low-density lipoprotein receptor-related protein 3-like n=1 Tax=Mercenaria mercenaria TaxID=6596 RepID=UPI00234E836B|nr:low-density lipoprotein receptor-related protein 3-like [Mercenaria mercenaria]
MKGIFLCLNVVCLLVLLPSFTLSIDGDYLNLVCNKAVYVGTSRKLESSTSLYYEPNTACYFSVTVDSGKKVMLLMRRFDLESEVKNACVDFVNVHDGSSTSDATLNSSPLCGSLSKSNYTSTSNTMTVYFETDATGNRHGFDFIFVAVTTAPCSSNQFACNNSVCIDSSLQCNIYDECGDNTDEENCVYPTLNGVEMNENAPLIIGLTIGLFIAAIVGVIVGLWCWKQNRWRLFAKRPLTAEEVVFDETTYSTTYPVTKVYYKGIYQDMYSDPVKAAGDYGSSTVTFNEQASTSTRKDAIMDE